MVSPMIWNQSSFTGILGLPGIPCRTTPETVFPLSRWLSKSSIVIHKDKMTTRAGIQQGNYSIGK
ncbi:MAG: hypothetical protein ACK4FS_09610 [Flavobacterium sp.]